LIGKDRDENQGELSHFLQGKAIHIHVRRNFIYEDAFDKLSPDNGEKKNYLGKSINYVTTQF
jgi:ubiquitin-protein ligase E3 C